MFNIRRFVPAVAGLGLVLSSGVHAAVPTAVTDSITTAQADAVTVAGLVLALIFAVAAFKWMRSAK